MSSLCFRCQEVPWGPKGWQAFNAEKFVADEKPTHEPHFDYEASYNELRESAQKGCWWCGLLDDHMSRHDRWPDHKMSDVLKFHMRLEIPGRTHPPRVGSVITSISSRKEYKDAGGTWLQVGVFTRSEQAAHIFVKDPCENEPRFNRSLVKIWLQDCCNNHVECKLDQPRRLPSRVLDVSPDSTSTHVRVYCSGVAEEQDYIFLSYRWGMSQSFVFNSASEERLLNGFHVNELPGALKDAVEVTRQLGVRYLWIDALCIKQDSSEDTVKEIAKMADYVRRATLVLQPSGLSSVQNSFLNSPLEDNKQIRKRLTGFADKYGRSQEIDFHTADRQSVPIVLDASPQWYLPDKEPTNSRGWTLQERLLCPRVLIFPSMGGMVWQCDKVEIPNGKLMYGFLNMNNRNRLFQQRPNRYRPQSVSLTAEEIHDSWLSVVDEYGPRDLTDPHDRFTAVSALARVYSDRYGEQLGKYCAGIWYNFIDRSLHWKYFGQHELQQAYNPVRAPSWSWASSDQNMFWMHHKHSLDPEYRMEIISCETYLVSPELPFGRVTGGKLTVRAILLGVLCFPDGWVFVKSTFHGSPTKESRFGHADADFIEYVPPEATDVFYLPLFDHEGLLLRHQKESGTFIRVAICSRSPVNNESDVFKGIERRLITIE